MADTPKKLTLKIKKFCKEYIKDFNATQACIRAGYSKNGANAKAAQLLAFISIQKYIQELIQKSDDKDILERKEVLAELALLVFSNPQNVFNDHGSLLHPLDIPEATARSISSIKVRKVINYEESTKEDKVFDDIVEIKFHDKPRSIDMAMKHLGEYKHELKVTGEFNVNHSGTINDKSSDQSILDIMAGRVPDYEAAKCGN